MCAEDLIAFGIVVRLAIVDGTINLDDGAGGVTIEISDEAIDHLLASEVQS